MLAQVQRAAPLPGTQVVFVTIDPRARQRRATCKSTSAPSASSFIGARGDAPALAPLLERA